MAEALILHCGTREHVAQGLRAGTDFARATAEHHDYALAAALGGRIITNAVACELVSFLGQLGASMDPILPSMFATASTSIRREHLS